MEGSHPDAWEPLTEEDLERKAKIMACIDAIDWVTEHPDAPIDPMLKAFVEIVKSGAEKRATANA